MTIFGVRLRSPGVADLPVAILLIVSAIVISVVAVNLYDWSAADVSPILFGFVAASITTSLGVNLEKHGLAGIAVLLLILAALVGVVALGFYLLGQ